MTGWMEIFLAGTCGMFFGYTLCALMTQAKVDGLVADLAHHIQSTRCPRCKAALEAAAEFESGT